MSGTATLTTACPRCGNDVTVTVTLALGEAALIDGRYTVSPSVGIAGEPHFCPAEQPVTLDAPAPA